MDTRAWLLKQHGPVCAYCGSKYTARVMTLDHVAPRRGQTAYDRRDNLVLAWKACEDAGLALRVNDEPLDRPRDRWLAEPSLSARPLSQPRRARRETR